DHRTRRALRGRRPPRARRPRPLARRLRRGAGRSRSRGRGARGEHHAGLHRDELVPRGGGGGGHHLRGAVRSSGPAREGAGRAVVRSAREVPGLSRPMSRLRGLLFFVLHNFGPLVAFLLVYRFFGLLAAIATSMGVALLEVVLHVARKKAPTRLFVG